MTGGIPNTVTIQIIDFTHSPLFDLGTLTNTSLTLDIDVKPSVTMRYLLTQPQSKRSSGNDSRQNTKSGQRGATLVEFAIGATVFLTAMFAVIEFGRALWTHNALADAARRAARYAVNQPASTPARSQDYRNKCWPKYDSNQERRCLWRSSRWHNSHS